MFGLIKDKWILISAFVFNLLQDFVLIEIYKENLPLRTYAVGKERSILIVFSNNCENSSLHKKIKDVVIS